ncbi:MAG: hypothetical protein FJY17_06305 [Bacteroidetes bacterium]|nr:hypothetical protein [Bacteroidota bacterium]
MKNPFNKSTFLLVAVAIIFSSCGGGNTDAKKSDNELSTETEKISGPLKLNEKYYFNDKNDELNCFECDPCWQMEFTDESNGELWSKPWPCYKSSSLKSCKSTFSYEYNKETKTVTIKSINNSHVPGACKSKFIGDWVWSKGKAPGERFYSKNNPGADFS